MASAESKPKFKYPEEDLYASIDPLAVLALIGGMVSMLSVVFSPIFIVFGIVGAILGLSSLFRINQSDGTLSGFWVATSGICLAVLFVISYFTYSVVRDARICSTSRQFAEEWIEKIRVGELNEAHQLTMGFFERVLPGTDLEEHYSSAAKVLPTDPGQAMQIMADISGTPHDQKTDFFSQPSLKIIKEQGVNCEVEFVRNLKRTRKGKLIDYVTQEFKLTYKEDGETKTHMFTLTLLREQYPGNYGAHWAIDMIDEEFEKIDRTRKRN